MKTVNIICVSIIAVVIVGIGVAAIASPSPSPMVDARKAAAKMAPEVTAQRLQKDYKKRGVSGKVRCEDFDAGTQFCTVTDHGHRVARLKVKLNVLTGAIDAEPIIGAVN
jgi:type II secretory pathway pseudopilin PulG